MAHKIKTTTDSIDHVYAGEKLWVDESGENLVPDGDESAAVLFAVEGDEISREDAVRYGLVKPTADEKKALAADEE